MAIPNAPVFLVGILLSYDFLYPCSRSGTGVCKAPNGHRTQASILGFRIRQTHEKQKEKKKKRKCYELSKAKPVRSLRLKDTILVVGFVYPKT